MAFTLVGWNESQDSATLVEHAALADQHITVTGDDIRVPDFANKLIGAFATGANITLARFSSPSLRARNLLDIAPLNVAAEPASPAPYHNYVNRPIELTPGEALQFLAAEDAAGAARQIGLAWLANGIDALPSGEIRTIRATTTGTSTANVWSLFSLTLGQQLEAGRYAIVGFRAQSATCIAARLVIPGSQYRPGVVAFDADSDLDVNVFRNGNLGSWGEFEHTFPPQVEVLTTAAETPDEFYLDVIKIG